MPTINLKIKCQSCEGGGLYVGMAERDRTAVVCQTCKGTGCQSYTFAYEEFDQRQSTPNVKWVYQTNPGIMVGGKTPEIYGGMSYDDWSSGRKFTRGMENRKCTCPAWWYQGVDYSRKPNWNECLGCGMFSSCSSFSSKDKCWKRWDEENP